MTEYTFNPQRGIECNNGAWRIISNKGRTLVYLPSCLNNSISQLEINQLRKEGWIFVLAAMTSKENSQFYAVFRKKGLPTRRRLKNGAELKYVF